MKYLWVSEAGYSADLALRVAAGGDEVRLWIMAKGYKDIYNGLLPKVDRWEGSVDWCDVAVFDHTGMSDIWKLVRKSGKPCFGGSEWADKLEKDRPYAKGVFKEIGLKSFESLKVPSLEDAKKHVLSHKVKHVVKPVGKEVESHNVIVSEDESGEDAAALIDSFGDLAVDYVEIEERKIGVEVGVSGWFIADGKGGGDWSGDININFEHKRFATGSPDGIGFLTGEMGTAMKYEPRDNRFFERTLARLRPILKKSDYRGQIDISFIVNDEGAWPLEATPRLGYPACMIEDEAQVSPWGELFYETSVGNSRFANKTHRDWCVGVVVVSPGFPSAKEAAKKSRGIPVFGVTAQNHKHIHLVEVEDNKGSLVVAPGQGYPLVVTGMAKTLPEAKKAAYKHLDQESKTRVRIPSAWWRVDIADRVMRQKALIEKYAILPAAPKPDHEIARLVL